MYAYNEYLHYNGYACNLYPAYQRNDGRITSLDVSVLIKVDVLRCGHNGELSEIM